MIVEHKLRWNVPESMCKVTRGCRVELQDIVIFKGKMEENESMTEMRRILGKKNKNGGARKGWKTVS